MAHSRLERIGTIYTRVTGLIRSGAMKLEDRPLWFEVYQAFPPATAPRYDRPAPKGEIRKIFYPEDVIRAKFYKKLPSVGSTTLKEGGRPSPCQNFLQNCRLLAESKGTTVEEVFDEAFASMKESLLASRESARLARDEASTPQRSGKKSSPNPTKSSVELEKIFSESESKPSGTLPEKN